MIRHRILGPIGFLIGLAFFFPGRSMAQDVLNSSNPFNFTSFPVAVAAMGMGNAVAADGSFFNASAYNPALLANNPDFAEVRILGLNVGNDPIGIANYLTGNNTLNNLQNSLQNVSQSFQNISNGLSETDGVTVNSGLYNSGVIGINNAVSNLQPALSNMTNKVIQLGIQPFNISLKFDDHWGFQIYNNSQAAVRISRGSLVQAILNMAAFPQMATDNVTEEENQAFSLYNQAAPLLNALLNPGQQVALGSAVTQFHTGAITAPQFAVSITNLMNNVSPNSSDQALFDDIAPVSSMVFTDTVAMATYCTRPLADDSSLSAGINFKIVNRRITSVTSDYLITQNTNGSSDVGNDIKDDFQTTVLRWGVDLGLLYDFDDPRVSLGVAATDIFHSAGVMNTNVGDPLNLNGGPVTIDPAPMIIRVGASWKVTRELTVNADMDDLFDNSSVYSGLGVGSHLDFGFNYNVLGILQLRGGLTNGNLCGGLGLPLGIQYAFAVDNLTQSYNHYLQLINVAF